MSFGYRVQALTLSGVLSVSGGCFLPIPLAIYPARVKGSGQSLEFRDEDGRRINTPGYIVVTNNGGDNPPDDGLPAQLLEIQGGKAKIPARWEWRWVCLGWFYGNPFAPIIGTSHDGHMSVDLPVA